MPDELTGLASLAELHRALDREFDVHRHSQMPIALVLVELDGLEGESADRGRAQDDAVLVGVAGVLRYLTGAFSEVARWDRDKFAIVLPGTDGEGAVVLAKRARAELEEVRIPHSDRGDEIRVRASFGVASAPENAYDRVAACQELLLLRRTLMRCAQAASDQR